MVTTSSLPPSTFFTKGGMADSTTAPTNQNQLVTRPPHHILRSLRRCPSNSTVDATIFLETTRSGAPEPTFGISRLEPQQSSANTSIRPENEAGSLFAASPPTMVPSRIAMNVAPSTSALAAGSDDFGSRSGRMPYLIGPNSEPITPKPASATNNTGTECIQNPITAMTATPI